MLIEALALAGMTLIMTGAVLVWRTLAPDIRLPATADESMVNELLSQRGRTARMLKLGAALITVGAALQPPMLLFG